MAINPTGSGAAYSADAHAKRRKRVMYKKLLVPVDGSELSERAMREGLELARQLGAAVVGFVAEPEMPMPNEGSQPLEYAHQRDLHETRTDTHAHEVLARFGELARAAGVAFTGRHLRTDQIDKAIVGMAGEYDCDLIVMATHGRGVFGELLFGSHTKSVLAKSTLPLLILR